MSDVINSQIQLWRQRSREGSMTTDDMKQAIEAIRKERVLSSAKSTASREKKAAGKAPIDVDKMFDELM